MQREARAFWTLILALLAASLYFGYGAEQRRRAAQVGDTVELETGDIVTLVHVVDGDTLMVEKSDRTRVVVRLLGIKALDPTDDRHGRYAATALRSYVADRPARVRVQEIKDGRTKIDRHGRVIAELFVDNRNVGISLVKDGLAVVYTVYPFDSINTYLEHQAKARELGIGLWEDATATGRADALIASWTREEGE